MANAKSTTKSGQKSGNKSQTSTGKNSKAKAKTQEIQAKRKADKRVTDEIWAIITIAIGAFFAVAVFSEGAGQLGEIIDKTLKGLFGWMAYVVPFYLIVFGALLFARKTSHFNFKTLLLLIIIFVMVCTMNSVHFIKDQVISLSMEKIGSYYTLGQTLQSGGVLGMTIAALLMKWIGQAGCWLFALVATLVCLLLVINTPLSRFFEKIGEKIEERKLMRENAHLDEEYEDAHGTQTAMNLNPKKENPNPQDKRDIRIIGAAAEEKYIAPSEKVGAVQKKTAANNLLSYMNDNKLFGREEASGTKGLEEQRKVDYGYGLEGSPTMEEAFRTAVDEAHVQDVNPEPAAFKKGPIAITSYEGEKEQTGTPDKMVVTRITAKEAGDAMLSSEEINKTRIVKKYKIPPLNLLEKSGISNKEPSSSLQAKAIKLEDTLKSFNVDASVIQVVQGPTVTRYEIQPAVGVKVSKIVNLADDIALNLRARSIRMEAPIPGKAAIGIEIENEKSTPVHLREIIDSKTFREARSRITFAVGKDIAGEVIVANLKDMPHLLIAGSTGSGKSVCINSIITSLLYKATPDEVKMILIDPKVVELSNYNGIPHLLIPVVTDATKAAAALNWAVAEMEERYNKFHIEGAKDLESYNDLVRLNDEPEKVLPQIVIIIDELADLMMAASSQVQDSICRIAQKARAAGMHLIVATQRPSVDVITGVIKANIPSRIAFAVSSHVDSQTILDEKGAEKLVGKGDMLFRPMGQGQPTRIQGCFVSDHEVNAIIDYVKSQVDETLDTKQNEIMARIERSDVSQAQQSQGADSDELLMDCIELVVDSGQASVSMLQRRFRIGYNRAARIVDIMEEMGVVGPQDGSRPRQVVLTREEFENLKQSTETE